ncbi:MAG: hypothetical protein IT200_01170 [Thermoleophilia bacterium]|nr:hypothetical protein [Thermoleophilia bacterium]
MDRPHDVADDRPRMAALPPPADAPVAGCPFCPGSEHETPPERWALRDHGPADGPGWRVRAVPNRYPVIVPPEGAHEVVVNSDRHVAAFWDLTAEQASWAARGWWEREEALTRASRRAFVFLNQGAQAGASLEHTHAQLVGLPVDPPRLAAREASFLTGTCPLCADLADPGDRLVARAGGLVAWCPRIPPLTAVVRIAPEVHAPRWDRPCAEALGRLLREVMRAAARVVGTDAANVWMHLGRHGGPDAVHWHVEAIPRIGTLAGLELGAGVYGLVVDPAAHAAGLRAAMAAPAADR